LMAPDLQEEPEAFAGVWLVFHEENTPGVGGLGGESWGTEGGHVAAPGDVPVPR
jgi:hypothetical protein